MENKIKDNAKIIAGLKINLRDYKANQYLEFCNYNGLMPIAFECNKGVRYGMEINSNSVNFQDTFENPLFRADKIFYYSTEPEFIHALQCAIIKYLELKQ